MHSEDVVYLVGTECRECSTILFYFIQYRFQNTLLMQSTPK